MRQILAISLIALSGIAFAASPQGMFSGEVRIGSAEPHAFDVIVSIGESKAIDIADGYTLELTVFSINKSVARLKNSEGQILHESVSNGPIQNRPTFIYQVCDSTVLFVSPAKPDVPVCVS